MFHKRWKLQTPLPKMVGFQSLLPGSKKNFHHPWSNTTKLKNENSWQTMCTMLPEPEKSFLIESRYKDPSLIFSSYHASNRLPLLPESINIHLRIATSWKQDLGRNRSGILGCINPTTPQTPEHWKDKDKKSPCDSAHWGLQLYVPSNFSKYLGLWKVRERGYTILFL